MIAKTELDQRAADLGFVKPAPTVRAMIWANMIAEKANEALTSYEGTVATALQKAA